MGIRKAFGSGGAGRVAVARAAGGGAARGPAAVLGVDCGGSVERGCGGWCRGFAGGRGALVSGGGRRAIINACAMVEAADRAAPVVCGAGRACDPACAGRGRAADRPPSRAAGVEPRGSPDIDHFAGAAAQRRHPQRRPGVSGHHGAAARWAGRPWTATAEPRVKNGPALAGHGAVRDAIACTITGLPQELRRSLTWDQGAEMSQHARLRIDAGVPVYFCDPHGPWHAARTRTPTGCCASISRRAPT